MATTGAAGGELMTDDAARQQIREFQRVKACLYPDKDRLDVALEIRQIRREIRTLEDGRKQ